MPPDQQNVNPQITIVVCTYNAEKYLAKALDSLLSQSYPNISILIIDDGSTDTTPHIIKEYKKITGVKSIILTQNYGTAYVRQKGLESAQTDLMMFFDADDIALPNLVEKQVKKITEDDKCIAAGTYSYYIGPDDDKKRLALQAIGVVTQKDFFDRFHKKKIHYTLPYTLFKKKFALLSGGYRQNGFEEYPQLRLQDISEDVDLWTRMADFGEQGYFMITIPKGFVLYRKMPGTLSANSSIWMGRKLRWIKHCVQRRRNGMNEKRFHDYLTNRSYWQQFRQYLEDISGYCYKRFTFKVLEKKYFMALVWGGGSFLLNPAFVFKKLKTQRFFFSRFKKQ